MMTFSVYRVTLDESLYDSLPAFTYREQYGLNEGDHLYLHFQATTSPSRVSLNAGLRSTHPPIFCRGSYETTTHRRFLSMHRRSP